MHKWSFSDVGSDRTSLICGHVAGHITGHKRDQHFYQREYTLCSIITEMTDITPHPPFKPIQWGFGLLGIVKAAFGGL